jgi:hypothetical protein
MIYGIFLSYHSKAAFLDAYQELNHSIWKTETFTPHPVPETFPPEENAAKNPVKAAALIGAIVGLATGFFMQWFADVVYSPMNIGGRPLNSWPAFIPVTWVLTVLFSGVSLFLTLWWRLGLPKPYHPVFNAKLFKLEPGHFGILIRQPNPETQLPTTEYLLKLHADAWEEVSC